MRSIFIFIMSICVIPVIAQQIPEKKLAVALERLRMAMIVANKVELEKLTSAKLIYGHSSGAVDDKAAFINKIISGRSDFVSMDWALQQVQLSRKTAVVRHRLDAITNDNGQPGEVHLWVMLVWQREKKHWKLLARQAVRVN